MGDVEPGTMVVAAVPKDYVPFHDDLTRVFQRDGGSRVDRSRTPCEKVATAAQAAATILQNVEVEDATCPKEVQHLAEDFL